MIDNVLFRHLRPSVDSEISENSGNNETNLTWRGSNKKEGLTIPRPNAGSTLGSTTPPPDYDDAA